MPDAPPVTTAVCSQYNTIVVNALCLENKVFKYLPTFPATLKSAGNVRSKTNEAKFNRVRIGSVGNFKACRIVDMVLCLLTFVDVLHSVLLFKRVIPTSRVL